VLLQKLLPLTKTMENFRLAVYETRCALSDLLQVIRTNKTSSVLRCQVQTETPPNICQDRLGTNIFPRESLIKQCSVFLQCEYELAQMQLSWRRQEGQDNEPVTKDDAYRQGHETALFCIKAIILCRKAIILPRQARDKHREKLNE
jgi:hypothetical protein